MDEELALAAPARAYGEWLEALGLPDLAEKARALLPETADGRAAVDTDTDSSRARSDRLGSVPGRRRLGVGGCGV